MPDVKLYGSEGALPSIFSGYQVDVDHISQDDMMKFEDNVRRAVAVNMRCRGSSVSLGQVDLHLFHSGSNTYRRATRSKIPQIIMEVAAYACVSRMDNIQERMEAIAIAINSALKEIGHKPAYISYTFIEVREGNWGAIAPNQP